MMRSWTSDGSARQGMTAPEGRVRVYISALVPELTAERAAAADAVTSLRLHPVFLADAGTRSHHAREVRRAYLEQSQVFVGIYGTGYGPVDPESAISAIHDEYLQAAGIPRLLYIRRSADAPEPALQALIRTFQAEDDASYASFVDTADLRRMVEADIATILSERFLERDDDLQQHALTTRSTVPIPLTTLIGREREVGDVRALMALHRLVTITGPGGTGKTRLAIDAVGGLEDPETEGPWFVDLSGLTRGDLIVPAVEQALGVVSSGHGGGAAGLAALIGSRRLLLVLDNCEQVIDEAAALVSDLLSRCRQLRVVCTSRQPLRIGGEHRYPLAPLTVAEERPDGTVIAGEAMRLFEERARQHVPEFALGTATFGAVRSICASLDGLPLAIELAAARLRLLTLAQLEQRLGARFALLSGGPRDRPDRQRTLAAAIDWSVALLSEVEQAMFLQLAVFRGGFELDAVMSVTEQDDMEVVDLVGELVEKSLIMHEGHESGRYRMLESLREYALWRMPEDERRELAARHLRWLTALTADHGPKLFGHEAAGAFARLVREQDNIRAALSFALERGDGAAALAICGDIGWFWYRRGPVEEGRRWIENALAAAPAEPQPKRPLAQVSLAGLHYLSGDLPRAVEVCLGARAEAEHFDDVMTTGRALTYAAYFVAFMGDLARSEALVHEARELGRARGVPMVVAEASSALGQLLRLRGDVAEAQRVLLDSAAIAREGGNRWLEGSSLWIAAKIDLDVDDADSALARLRSCLRLQAHEGDLTSTLVGLHTAAAALAVAGRPERGAMLLGAVDAIGGRIGYHPERMDTLDGPRNAARVRDSLPEAAFTAAFAEGRRLGLDDALALAGYDAAAVPAAAEAQANGRESPPAG
jgi:predicted ATPase